MKSAALRFQTVLNELENIPANKEPYVEPFSHGTMQLGLYAPRENDPQTPHSQDELYFVASGSGVFFNNGERVAFNEGDALFVAAGVEHRFEDYSNDFVAWVVFGAPGGRGKLNNSKKVKPLVGVPTCRQVVDGLDYDCTQHKYIRALHLSAGVLPLQIPLLENELELESILARLDGIMLTGSHSNIHPQHYASDGARADFKLDPFRDETILPLIKPVIEQGIPFFAICRGFQELNVAYGGELNPHLYQEGTYIEHRENKELDLAERYELAHTVELVPGGKLHNLFKQASVEVNSLHEQGIRSIGKGLCAEGHSEDGLIEAVSVEDSSNFAIGVQWHPEWKSTENQVSTRLFSAFGEACAAYAQTR